MKESTDWILLIDDDPIFIWLVQKMIAKLNDKRIVKTFANGEDALIFLKEVYAPNDSYLVLLDINMPIMNGWDFVDAIATAEVFNENKENFTIHIVSSSTDPADQEKAGQWSMVKGYFAKPLELDDMRLILGHTSA